MNRVTLGGERLGGGKKMKVDMHGFNRSTHDLSTIIRTTMSVGTLVPFYTEVALPGDTHDIDLEVDVMTLPTLGPLFGSMKVHIDLFFAPLRLYNAQLHQNKLGIGMNMSSVYLPRFEVSYTGPLDLTKNIDNQQVSSSALIRYLGVSGIGFPGVGNAHRRFNAVPLLAYWDIYKNYYANKQEANGAVIHTNPAPNNPSILSATIQNSQPNGAVVVGAGAPVYVQYWFNQESQIVINFNPVTLTADFQIDQILLDLQGGITVPANQIFENWIIDVLNQRVIGTKGNTQSGFGANIGRVRIQSGYATQNLNPTIYRFPLANIDTMRNNILAHPGGSAYLIPSTWPATAPYSAHKQNSGSIWSAQFAQEGLGLRTYSSDLFNNWLDTATIDGGTGITEVTKVNVTGNKFTIDELNLAKKVYEMLNRIAISGGTYDDWLDAVYDHERVRSIESPIYLGGALRNLVFQEVVGTATTENEPLGTLAGKGRMGSVKKGGRITAKINEPGYIMGIVSIVPNIDYSQGNKWDMSLRTMNDFHKPGLDEIGFQNLITDQMAWFDTLVTGPDSQTTRSAGKQPAWINYMTNINRVYGAFAEENQQMFMVLNRRYNSTIIASETRIEDLTTYIDPTKFNHIFADTRLDAQNYWVQIAVNNTARRKMSAKVIPNL